MEKNLVERGLPVDVVAKLTTPPVPALLGNANVPSTEAAKTKHA